MVWCRTDNICSNTINICLDTVNIFLETFDYEERQWSGVGPSVDGRMFAINRPNVPDQVGWISSAKLSQR